jgi:putative DNA primase/helicase
MEAATVEQLRSNLRVVAGGQTFRRTDQGNAERLVAEHGHDLRYAPGIGWLASDGRRWRRDEDGEPLRRMKSTVRGMYVEAAGLDDDTDRKAAAKWAATSESESRLRAAVSLAESELDIIVRSTDLDAAPLLLNVENGTLDLSTGRLREHRRADLLTKLAPVTYRPDARSRRWERFLADVTGGDLELAEFLQRAVGYTLTGDTGEEVLFFAHGPAATGKTTMLEALKGVLGDYAATADFEAFLARPASGGARSDIARLAGARLVIGVEVDDGKRLAEGLLKQLTGGDTITARFMYRDLFEFRPAFKLWLAANHRPKVNGDDEAMWRRILQIPFTNVVPPDQRDPSLKRALTADPDVRSAILTWAVQGCLEWQQHGLGIPAAVRDYTAEYRAENDPLADWLTDCCALTPDAATSAGDLRASYEHHAQRNGDRPISSRKFGEALRARGCTPHRGAQGRRGWNGIALQVTAGDVTVGKSPS